MIARSAGLNSTRNHNQPVSCNYFFPEPNQSLIQPFGNEGFFLQATTSGNVEAHNPPPNSFGADLAGGKRRRSRVLSSFPTRKKTNNLPTILKKRIYPTQRSLSHHSPGGPSKKKLPKTKLQIETGNPFTLSGQPTFFTHACLNIRVATQFSP